MATYYIDPAGSDSDDGLSSSTAWQTVAKVNGSTFLPGDSIMFKRDGTWREQLTAPSSGTSGSPITLGAYGTGDNPIFKGSDIKLNASFSLNSGTTYQIAHTPASTNNVWVYEDGVRLTPASSLANCQATPGSSWYASNVLYVNASDSSNVTTNGKVYEAFARIRCIYTNGKNWLVIEDFEAQHTCGNVGGIAIYGDDNVVRRCTSAQHGDHSVIVGGPGNRNMLSYMSIGPSSGSMIVFFQSANCTLRNSLVDGTHTWGANLTQMHGAGCASNVIEQCLIRQSVNGSGTDDYGLGISDSGCTNNTIRHCRFEGYIYRVIHMTTATTGHKFYGNVCYLPELKNTAINVTGGSSIEVYGNTLYVGKTGADRAGLSLDATSSATFKNNILWSATTGFTITLTTGATLTSDYNHFNSGRSGCFNSGSGFIAFANWKIAGYDANSTFGDPLLSNVALGDLTLSDLSPCEGVGVDLGSTYAVYLHPESIWPDDVIFLSQPASWDIGAYAADVPIPSSSSSSDSSESSSSDSSWSSSSSSESSESDESSSSSSSNDELVGPLPSDPTLSVFPTILIAGVMPGPLSKVDQMVYKHVRMGNWPAPVRVTLHTPYMNSEIRYTLGGTNPNPSSKLYKGPLFFRENVTGSDKTVIKARIYDKDNKNKKSRILRLDFRVI